jgi:hypothetical protein
MPDFTNERRSFFFELRFDHMDDNRDANLVDDISLPLWRNASR